MARNFQNWLKAYTDFTRDSESPTPFHFWTGVSTVAGALRRRVWIDMKKFQWTPNFYIILVGPPGVAAKSTSISMGMSLLAKVQGVRFGPESMTWQKLAKSLSEATEYLDYLLPDGAKALTAMSCNTIEVAELGTFLNTEDDKLMSFLINMWDGKKGKFRHDTISGGLVEIDNPWLNVIAATTPSWLRAHYPESMIGGGLTSRIVFVYGDKKRFLVPYPDEVIPDAQYRKMESELIADLAEIAKLAGPYQLSSFARQWGKAWYADHNDPDNRPQHLSSERYAGYLARKQTHVHKFAIILAAAKRDNLVIEEDDLREAETVISTIEADMLKVFESIGASDQRSHVESLLHIVTHFGMLSNKGLWARAMAYMNLKEFEEAVRAAVHAKLLDVVSVNNVPHVVIPKKGP